MQIGYKVLAVGALCCSALWSGCNLLKSRAKETAPPSVLNPVEETITTLGTVVVDMNSRSTMLDAKLVERDGKILADANAAQKANQSNPEGVPKAQVASHLTVLKGRLGETKEDPAAAAKAAERDMLFEMGRAAEARAATDAAVGEALKQGSELIKAQEELRKLRVSLTGEITSLQGEVITLKTTIASNTAANQVAIDNALSRAQQEARKEQSRWLTLGAIVLMVAGLLLAYAKFNAGEPIKAAIVGGFFGGGAFFCASLAYLLTEPWFQKFLKVSIISGSITAVVAGIVWLVMELRSAKEKKVLAETAATLDRDASEADATLLKVYDTLEKSLPPEVLAPLVKEFSSALDANEKAYVNELKALRQRGLLSTAKPAA